MNLFTKALRFAPESKDIAIWVSCKVELGAGGKRVSKQKIVVLVTLSQHVSEL
jgi:hypothetical protein